MSDKGRFGPGLTEAEIDALVDNTTPRNTKEVLLILLGLAGYLTIIPRARMGSESIAHEAEGRMGY